MQQITNAGQPAKKSKGITLLCTLSLAVVLFVVGGFAVGYLGFLQPATAYASSGGGLNLNEYCANHGATQSFWDGNTWWCTGQEVNNKLFTINMQNACDWTYGLGTTPVGSGYNISCQSSQETLQLGGLNLNAYCQAFGAKEAIFWWGGWLCRTARHHFWVININSACNWTYGPPTFYKGWGYNIVCYRAS